MPHAQALTWYKWQTIWAAAAGDTAGVGRACENLGACYNSMGQHAQALPLFEQARAAFAAVDDTAGVARACFGLAACHGNMGQYPPPPPAGVDYASAPEAGAAYGSRSVTPELDRTNNGTLEFRRQNPAGVQARADAVPALHSAPEPLPLYAATSYATSCAEWGENPSSDEDASGDAEEESVLERRGDIRPLDPPGPKPPCMR